MYIIGVIPKNIRSSQSKGVVAKDKEIERIEKEPKRLKLQEIFASGRIDGLYFVMKALDK